MFGLGQTAATHGWFTGILDKPKTFTHVEVGGYQVFRLSVVLFKTEAARSAYRNGSLSSDSLFLFLKSVRGVLRHIVDGRNSRALVFNT